MCAGQRTSLPGIGMRFTVAVTVVFSQQESALAVMGFDCPLKFVEEP